MKQIINNNYIKAFEFTSSQESSTFVTNQGAKKHLSIIDTFGDKHYCYVSYHSLTKEKQFSLSFSSDDKLDSLNFLFWDGMIVMDTANKIYLIDENLSIKNSLEITTPMVGLYLISNEKLLVLEEAYMRVIDYNGEIVKAELFDLIENFSINENWLSIQTSNGNKAIQLV